MKLNGLDIEGDILDENLSSPPRTVCPEEHENKGRAEIWKSEECEEVKSCKRVSKERTYLLEGVRRICIRSLKIDKKSRGKDEKTEFRFGTRKHRTLGADCNREITESR